MKENSQGSMIYYDENLSKTAAPRGKTKVRLEWRVVGLIQNSAVYEIRVHGMIEDSICQQFGYE